MTSTSRQQRPPPANEVQKQRLRFKKSGTRVKRVRQPIETPTSAIDEMAELLMLEEENKRLRKSLAEKLRGENADLRKRLGLD
ncbi:hypothetical protein LZK77_31410 (plasmid) [Rhizobium leguminosarum]|nr:hypothetical protein LZK77_31410 [Rhizobium leguminosarum]